VRGVTRTAKVGRNTSTHRRESLVARLGRSKRLF
jgi:hypothetical protein